MCLKVVAWAAAQYFPTSDQQLIALVLAERAGEDGVVGFREWDRGRLMARTGWDRARLMRAVIGLYRCGACDPYPAEPEVRLAIGRRFDFRIGRAPAQIIVVPLSSTAVAFIPTRAAIVKETGIDLE